MKEIHRCIIQVDKNGRISLPEEIAKNIHSNLLDFEVNGYRLSAKEPELDYIFIMGYRIKAMPCCPYGCQGLVCYFKIHYLA